MHNALMVCRVFIAGLTACCLVACTLTASNGSVVDAAGLGKLTADLHENMLLRHDMDRFAEVAARDYMVMIPNGRVESRAQDIAGAVNFHIDALKISNVVTHPYQHSAVVTGTWTLTGHLRDTEMSGDYDFMSFWERGADRWVLVAESVTRRRSSLEAALSG